MPLQIVRQDITKMQVDAIVNTTNEEMIGYSGVDKAIHDAAGPELDIACSKLAPLGLGTAKITEGFNLGVKYIIHTSGPIWQGGLNGESIILKSCYIEALKLALQYNCNSIAFPLISSGAYGYPKDRVLRFATQVISEFLYDHEMTVYLCVFDRTSYEFSKQLFNEISEIIGNDYIEKSDGKYDDNICCSAVLGDFSCLEEEEKSTTEALPIVGGSVPPRESKVFASAAPKMCSVAEGSARDKSLQEYMKAMDKTFAYKLFDLIDKCGMTDVECYKKANIDKKTFSKIKCHPNTYKPSKQTAVAFAIALELDLEETQDLLASAGLTLSRSFKFDKIIRYFIQKEIYDIFIINEALFEFDQMLLGC